MLVTIDQIRAARALLNWSQAELATQAGLARPTVVNIETGQQSPELHSLQKIVAAFERADIEFGAHEAVRRRADDVKIYRGEQEFVKFFEEVLEYARSTGGRIFVSNVDERHWISTKGDFFISHYAIKMQKMRKNLDFRILIKEGDTYTPADKYATYRWVAAKDFASIPFHVYGDRLSVILFLEEPIIISVKNQRAADLYKEKFIQQWDKAMEMNTQPGTKPRSAKAKKKK